MNRRELAKKGLSGFLGLLLGVAPRNVEAKECFNHVARWKEHPDGSYDLLAPDGTPVIAATHSDAPVGDYNSPLAIHCSTKNRGYTIPTTEIEHGQTNKTQGE